MILSTTIDNNDKWKTWLRSQMGQKMLVALALLNVHREFETPEWKYYQLFGKHEKRTFNIAYLMWMILFIFICISLVIIHINIIIIHNEIELVFCLEIINWKHLYFYLNFNDDIFF